MNISDLNHLEIVSEESITDLIGAGTASAAPNFLITLTGPNGASFNSTVQIQMTASNTSNFVGISFVGQGFVF